MDITPSPAPAEPRITWTSFSSANEGLNPDFMQQAREFGEYIAGQKHHYRYGGDVVGLMGAVYYGIAETRDKQECHSVEKSRIVAVPLVNYHKPEIDYLFDDVIVTHSLKEQHELLCDPADYGVAFPGGIGTLGEISDMLEYLRCKKEYEKKALWMINTNDYYTPLVQYFQHMVKEKTAKEKDFTRVHVVGSVSEMTERLHEPPKFIL